MSVNIGATPTHDGGVGREPRSGSRPLCWGWPHRRRIATTAAAPPDPDRAMRRRGAEAPRSRSPSPPSAAFRSRTGRSARRRGRPLPTPCPHSSWFAPRACALGPRPRAARRSVPRAPSRPASCARGSGRGLAARLRADAGPDDATLPRFVAVLLDDHLQARQLRIARASWRGGPSGRHRPRWPRPWGPSIPSDHRREARDGAADGAAVLAAPARCQTCGHRALRG